MPRRRSKSQRRSSSKKRRSKSRRKRRSKSRRRKRSRVRGGVAPGFMEVKDPRPGFGNKIIQMPNPKPVFAPSNHRDLMAARKQSNVQIAAVQAQRAKENAERAAQLASQPARRNTIMDAKPYVAPPRVVHYTNPSPQAIANKAAFHAKLAAKKNSGSSCSIL